MEPSLEDVLEKAARLQELVPGAVLVGGSAAALHAHHRESRDHDHVVADLAERFDSILENLEALGDWSTARIQPGKIILGELGGIETGVRQLLRERPLESIEVQVRGKRLVVPTAAEILRIKAWLALGRNQTRDYLDIAALADGIGLDEAACYGHPTGRRRRPRGSLSLLALLGRGWGQSNLHLQRRPEVARRSTNNMKHANVRRPRRVRGRRQ
jgi:hypothetical protein